VVNAFLSLFSIFFLRYGAPHFMRAPFAAIFLLASALSCPGQEAPPGEVRVSVVLNPDGSRTTYETDATNRKCVATTRTAAGKAREKINYDLDENGRFARGQVLGPKGEFRFLAQYKYDGNNHVTEEVRLDQNQNVVGRIVFQYDAAGHQTGYAVYDGAGKILGQTAPVKATPAKRK
jgi:hypothetical protein